MRNTRCEPAFTIAELLLALAITSILLAAVAVAFNASVINYQENEDIFKTTNSARQALLQITNRLRTASAVDPNSPVNECSFYTASGENITYDYRSADGKLYLVTNSNGQEYVLCDNVTAMTFQKDTGAEGGTVYVKSVQISITVVNGNAQRTVSAAVVIRRNLK